MEVQGNCGIKTQTGCPKLVTTAGAGQDNPTLSCRIAHEVAERRDTGRRRALGSGERANTAEEKAIAAVQNVADALVTGEEGQRGANQLSPIPSPPNIGEVPSFLGEARVVARGVEHAGEGLGEPPAVVGVGDEGAPVPGDALEVAERLDWEPCQDLNDEVVGEAVRRAAHLLLPGPLRHLARNLRTGWNGGDVRGQCGQRADRADEERPNGDRRDKAAMDLRPLLFEEDRAAARIRYGDGTIGSC